MDVDGAAMTSMSIHVLAYVDRLLARQGSSTQNVISKCPNRYIYKIVFVL